MVNNSCNTYVVFKSVGLDASDTDCFKYCTTSNFDGAVAIYLRDVVWSFRNWVANFYWHLQSLADLTIKIWSITQYLWGTLVLFSCSSSLPCRFERWALIVSQFVRTCTLIIMSLLKIICFCDRWKLAPMAARREKDRVCMSVYNSSHQAFLLSLTNVIVPNMSLIVRCAFSMMLLACFFNRGWYWIDAIKLE